MKHDDAAKDKPMMRRIAKDVVGDHEARMHPGKTPTFAKGGKTNANMKKLGRGLAKVFNQKSSSKSRGR